MSAKGKILIVEDDQAIAIGLRDVFLFHGYAVETERDGKAGLERGLAFAFDLAILDVMLPGQDGFSICQGLREAGRDTAVIMLTARTEDSDIIEGFSLGADDYVTKPFSIAELVARVEAVLRRTRREMPSKPFRLERWSVDPSMLEARSNCGAVVKFTRRELEVLLYLASHQERPVKRAELLAEVWGYRRAARMETRTVDIHIAKLRRKLEANPAVPSILLTVRSSGYLLKGL